MSSSGALGSSLPSTCVAVLVVAAYGLWAPVAALPSSRALEAVASWLPIGDVALRVRLAMGLCAALVAWAISRSLAMRGGAGGAIAGGFAACLLVSSPAWLGAGLGPAVATGAALLALASARRLAMGGAAHDAAHDAGAASVAVAIAVAFEPGFAGLAVPVVALWWLRVGQRAARGLAPRRARSAPHAPGDGRMQLMAALIAPALALVSLAVAFLRAPAGPALLWPGWKLGGAALFASEVGGAVRAHVEMLGPTAAVAAAAGALALLLPARRLNASAADSGDGALVAEAPAGPWLLALLAAMAVSGTFFDLARGSLGVPAVMAVALLAGFAISRLAAMAVITIGPADEIALRGAILSSMGAGAGAESGAVLGAIPGAAMSSGASARIAGPLASPGSGAMSAMAPMSAMASGPMAAALAPPSVTITAGAIFVALAAGFLVLAPSLLF